MCWYEQEFENCLYYYGGKRRKRRRRASAQAPSLSSPNSETAVWTGEKGRIDRAMLVRHLSDNDLKDSIFYICGPPVMINAMQTLIENELQIPKERIKIEDLQVTKHNVTAQKTDSMRSIGNEFLDWKDFNQSLTNHLTRSD